MIPQAEARMQLGLSSSKLLVLFVGDPSEERKRFWLARDVSGLANATVVLVKGLLFAVGLVGLALSVRAAVPSKGAA